jgi:hypothetical protein
MGGSMATPGHWGWPRATPDKPNLNIWLEVNGRNYKYLLYFKLKEGLKYKTKNLRGEKIYLGRQIYKITYFKENLKTFGGTFAPHHGCGSTLLKGTPFKFAVKF